MLHPGPDKMKCIKKKVLEEFEQGWIGSNTACEYHPCHYKGQDCTYCYCPFYPCNDPSLGKLIDPEGKRIWDCSDCLFIHQTDVCKYVSGEVERLGIIDTEDVRLTEIFKESKKRYFRKGKAIMVLGATSDAGKSLTAMAICRIISDMGYSVTPLKTQNMSLNSVVTHDGCEIAMIQALQARAAGIKRADRHINPILLKPKGDSISQVMVNGKPFGDYDVQKYYSEFVPGPGIKAVEEAVEYLKYRFNYVVIEGAGSPAEINIYDSDIANMKAAEIADAECVLVVNVSWGGSFAYALGTIELLENRDRKRVKGVIFNNLHGTSSEFNDGVKEFEKVSKVPVLGIVPHIDITLPKEDSEFFRESREIGEGKTVISVIKLPRISNFTDLDPLLVENVTIKFVSKPEELNGTDAIIIPGTKNTISDMMWLRSSGMADAILSFKGSVPILGICGGYQMMGSKLIDKKGLENLTPTEMDGLGLFDGVTEWKTTDKTVKQVSGTLIPTGEHVQGYEIHAADSVMDALPLLKMDFSQRTDGSFIESEMLFGTYAHGIFERPAFRRFFLSFTGNVSAGDEDYSDKVEMNLQKLADSFKSSIDMEMFKKVFMGL